MVQQASRKPVFPPGIAPYIDVAAYLLDARAPAVTLYLDELLLGKELLLLTRSGQADLKTTARWKAYFTKAGYTCLVIDAVSRDGLPAVFDYLAGLLKRKLAVAKRRGIQSATLRMAALGVPNVGKSTFLNCLMGEKRLRTGDKPGITRGRQWVRLFDDVEVLDTPGLLRDPAALNRRKPYWMLLNLMPYDAALREEAVELLMGKLPPRAWDKLKRYYDVPDEHFPPGDWLEMLNCAARRGGFQVKDDDGVDRAARRLLHDYQHGRFGRHTLEEPGVDMITSPLFNPPAV